MGRFGHRVASFWRVTPDATTLARHRPQHILAAAEQRERVLGQRCLGPGLRHMRAVTSPAAPAVLGDGGRSRAGLALLRRSRAPTQHCPNAPLAQQRGEGSPGTRPRKGGGARHRMPEPDDTVPKLTPSVNRRAAATLSRRASDLHRLHDHDYAILSPADTGRWDCGRSKG